jgi:CO/xanthine dehydrogenase FAD-binding subunit
MVDEATIVAVGAGGERRIPIDAFFVRSGVTARAPGELVTAIELPHPGTRRGTVHLRRTRRRGHDLASVTLACSVDVGGVTRIAYGSVGPRPVLAMDASGVLADPDATDDAKRARLAELFVDAAPSPTSMRASPDYRLAMLHLLGLRGVRAAIERLRAAA